MRERPFVPLIGLPGCGPIRIVWHPASDHPLSWPTPAAAIGADPNPFPTLRFWSRRRAT